MKLNKLRRGLFCLGILFFFKTLFTGSLGQARAVFKEPVADLFFEQLSKVYDNKLPIDQLYQGNPLFALNCAWGCPRAIQCLFNEVVDILACEGEEILIQVSHMFYAQTDRAPMYRAFWTHQNNLIMMNDLDKDLLLAIPAPVNYCDCSSVIHPEVITLTMPWLDPVTKKIYSAGTRFVRKPEYDTASSFALELIDIHTLSKKISYVDRSSAIVYAEQSPEERQEHFVALLKRWADHAHGIVPYVWGGASLTHFVSDDEFEHSYAKFAEKLVAFWSHREAQAPCGGMDCSLMIFRAAQICGIPYFFKNTYTLSKYLRPIRQNELLENGDMVWYDGHVMVISDVVNNKILESCGYPFGFGKLHEIAMNKRLAGMHTCDDLLQEYFGHRCLGSLDKDGIVRRIVEDFQIFKFSSVWECAQKRENV